MEHVVNDQESKNEEANQMKQKTFLKRILEKIINIENRQ
jgi:hypothetical protein